ncbi:MAG: hypothetical protein WBC29_04540, partial [Candidatus Moraniibacteriota bacterium]
CETKSEVSSWLRWSKKASKRKKVVRKMAQVEIESVVADFFKKRKPKFVQISLFHLVESGFFSLTITMFVQPIQTLVFLEKESLLFF